MTDDLKTCTKCNTVKTPNVDFYKCQGKYRSECKSCTIKNNVRHQKSIKAWANRFVDEEKKKSYMVDYYAKNKEKFAEYRRKFRDKYPGYAKEYARKRKSEVK